MPFVKSQWAALAKGDGMGKGDGQTTKQARGYVGHNGRLPWVETGIVCPPTSGKREFSLFSSPPSAHPSRGAPGSSQDIMEGGRRGGGKLPIYVGITGQLTAAAGGDGSM